VRIVDPQVYLVVKDRPLKNADPAPEFIRKHAVFQVQTFTALLWDAGRRRFKNISPHHHAARCQLNRA
jgi:hypothetical protein